MGKLKDKHKDYRFRACVVSCLIGVGIILFAANTRDIRTVAPLLMLMVVVLGCYEVKEVIGINAAVTTFILLYLFAFDYEYTVNATDNPRGLFIEICMSYVIEIIAYYRIHRQIRKDRTNAEIIEKLEDAQNTKDDFLVNVSHEIRTPVNTICGMSEIVLRSELDDKIREEIGDIQTAGKKLLSIVSDILDFSELSSGKIDVVNNTYNITSTINNVLNMLMSRYGAKNIEIVVDCDVNIPSGLVGDEPKIRRVMFNLLDNAIKFTNEGGIELSVFHRKTAYGVNLIVTVSDTGIGMKDESIEKLFKSFSQGDAQRNKPEGGLGLGLAISKALVEKMGGFIKVDSELGKGTVIQFVIPQMVSDETPVIVVRNPENINAAVWISLEKVRYREIRDRYNECIKHMISQLKVKCNICRGLGDLKRKSEWEGFTHVFITMIEYNADREYFDELSKNIKVIIIISKWEEKEITNRRIYKIYKPFYSLTVVMAFNNEQTALEYESRMV